MRTAILICTIAAAALAQNKPMKDERGKCQAAAPANAVVILSHMAQAPDKSWTATVDHDGSEKFSGPKSKADLEKYHYSQAFENTAARLFVEKESHAVTAGYRAFHVYVPTATGQCHLGISFKAGTPEEPLKAFAKTLSAIK
jgi:hypothetical protein